ncbi:MAG: amidohydrolase family protein, partial [Acidobacteriaceae bacterium]
MAIIIKSGTLITASETFQADILVEGEKITSIASEINLEGAEVIDAAGMLVLPGGVDPHTHFNLPMFGTVSSDDHYTGHKAAAFGGTTTALDFISMDLDSIPACVEAWHERADSLAAIDYGFHMNITHFDQKVAGELAQLPDLGISSLKVFTAYNDRLRLQDAEIFQVLRLAKRNELLTMLHAENGDVIDILVVEALAEGHTTPEWHARTRPAWGA